MKLLILGATGNTGKHLVTQALEAGHEVTAIVRNPDKMKTTIHDKLKVVEGDIFSETSLLKHMTGHDAVLSCLGTHSSMMGKVTFYSESIKSITAAMRGAGVNKFIGITSWYTTNVKGPFLFDWVLKPLFLKNTLGNMALMETYLTSECADINYTVVKPPGLEDGNVSEKVIKAEEGQYVRDGAYCLLRADLARFMLSCLDTKEWDRKLVSIAHE